jgi:hypothetical protein
MLPYGYPEQQHWAARSKCDNYITVTSRIAGRRLDAIRSDDIVMPNLEDGFHVQRWLQRINDAHTR